MNSAPVMDSPAASAAGAAIPQLAAPPLKGNVAGAAPFGDVLQKASSKAAPPTDVAPDESDADLIDSLLPAKEPADEKEKPITDLLPLICFCPPPEIKVPPPPPPKEESSTVSETPIEPASKQTEVIPAQAAPIALETKPVETQPCESATSNLVEAITPKEKPSREAKFTAPKTDSPKAVELDTKIFEAIAPKPVEMPPLHTPKPPQATPPEPPPIPNGTVVAQLGNAMKNGAKSAEITSGNEQKMPVREVSRRPAVTSARFDSSTLISSAPSRLTTDFKIEAPAEAIPLHSPVAVHLIENIRTEVANLRQLNQSAVSLVLKPDASTELKIQVTVAHDGSIQAQAHCERGDFHSLNAQWPQLQQSLAAHGIQIANLSNPGNGAQNQQHSSGGHGSFANAQNFDSGNPSQNRQQQRNAPSFEEELAANTPRFPSSKSFKQTAGGTTRRWQSWA